jgi:hypothetical protein
LWFGRHLIGRGHEERMERAFRSAFASLHQPTVREELAGHFAG